VRCKQGRQQRSPRPKRGAAAPARGVFGVNRTALYIWGAVRYAVQCSAAAREGKASS